MTDEDQPPETIWLDNEALNTHFEWVRDKYKSKKSGMESVPDPGDMGQNEITKGLR